ncbi:hypothetical protein K1719_021405 [Acacia pycnantha]|nr:hypothetical protein K1719_021405 [Acacia pycnantha]
MRKRESERGKERGRGKVSGGGGKEGSGVGDGVGDGDNNPTKGVQVAEGKDFTFGRMAESGRRFLVKHSEEDDIVQGWKDYFHKMNEKETQSASVEVTEEEDSPMTRRMEGKPGKLSFTAEEYTTWCLPWMNTLIIKVLGASFPTYVIRDRINRMWHPKDPLKLIPLSNGYYIVSFSNKEDREYAFQEGPWMIEDHYLIVQRWRPNFNPWKADFQCIIAAWIRLPDVPFEFYNVESLRRIGNMIGKMIKVDRSTSIYDKGGFARICVEIDLKKPLVPTYMVFGEERPIIYEGLHHVCFACGKYGHQKVDCPMKEAQKKDQSQEHGHMDAGAGGDEVGVSEKAPDVGAEKIELPEKENSAGCDGGPRPGKMAGSGVGKSGVSGGDEDNGSPFGKIRILRRDFRGALNSANLRNDFKGNNNQTVAQSFKEEHSDASRISRTEDEDSGHLENKGELTKLKGPSKVEWVQVGSKRKSLGKGKSKGKENISPAIRSMHGKLVGRGLEPKSSNSFKVLQGLAGLDAPAERVNCGKSNIGPEVVHAVPNEFNSCRDTEMVTSGSFLPQTKMNSDTLEDNNMSIITGPTHKHQVEQDSCDQDKALGKVEIPQHQPFVSQ